MDAKECEWAGLFGFSVIAVATLVPVAAAAESAGAFTNSFGLQLRRPPARAADVWAPTIVAPSPNNESCALARDDGTIEIYSVSRASSAAVAVIRSRDGGLSWSPPATAYALPGRAYYAHRELEAADGSLHAVFHILGAGEGGYRGRLYEVYHIRRPAGSTMWSPPQRVVPGYVGAIRGFRQLTNGRLVLAVGRAVPERATAPTSGPDRGWNDVFVYYSDDGGATWHESPDRLTLVLPGPNVTRHGAIEPVMLELLDHRVWMLVRDRGGRLWQSFSADGARWSPPERSPFISSDSPAELLRLRSGKIVLFANACQNWTDPRSYAMGGREVLHAAISADDGRTWRGFREVLHETAVVTKGDRGAAYASACESRDGKIVVAAGQGEGKRAIVMFDPKWLEETEVRDELSRGPALWTQYGAEGLRAATTATGDRVIEVPTGALRTGGALWNFPSADRGEISFTLETAAAVTALRLSLNDHFNRIDDREAAAHAVYTLPVVPAALTTGHHKMRLRWNGATRGGSLVVRIDDAPERQIAVQRPAQFGVNYLRFELTGDSDAALRVGELAARRLP